MKRHHRIALVVLCVGLVIGGLFVCFQMFRLDEVARYAAPDGYSIVVTKRRYEGNKLRMPGQGSDAPGFVEIFDSKGSSCGRVPIPMIWMARDIEWTTNGAEIRLVAEWDLKKRTCYYWSEQDVQVWVRR